MPGWSSRTARSRCASTLACSAHAREWSGWQSTSASTPSTTRSRSCSLLRTCRYRAPGTTPRRVARARMLRGPVPAAACGGFATSALQVGWVACEQHSLYCEQCYLGSECRSLEPHFSRVARAAGPARRIRENDMTTMTSWDLFEDLRGAQDDLLRMNRAYGQRLSPAGYFGQWFDPSASTQAWAPALDISERKDAYLVTVELPGVTARDVEIMFEDGLLTIQGERHPAGDPAAEKVHRAERRHGAFRRLITLPRHVQADAIEATAHDGVLQILVPKAPEMHAKRIQVQRGM